MKKKSGYREILEALRERHADKAEKIFLRDYDITQDPKATHRDIINASKVCQSFLDVGRSAPQKAPEKPPQKPLVKDFKEPALSPELEERLKSI